MTDKSPAVSPVVSGESLSASRTGTPATPLLSPNSPSSSPDALMSASVSSSPASTPRAVIHSGSSASNTSSSGGATPSSPERMSEGGSPLVASMHGSPKDQGTPPRQMRIIPTQFADVKSFNLGSSVVVGSVVVVPRSLFFNPPPVLTHPKLVLEPKSGIQNCLVRDEKHVAEKMQERLTVSPLSIGDKILQRQLKEHQTTRARLYADGYFYTDDSRKIMTIPSGGQYVIFEQGTILYMMIGTGFHFDISRRFDSVTNTEEVITKVILAGDIERDNTGGFATFTDQSGTFYPSKGITENERKALYAMQEDVLRRLGILPKYKLKRWEEIVKEKAAQAAQQLSVAMTDVATPSVSQSVSHKKS